MLWVKKLKPARNQCLVYRYIGQFAEELEQEQKIPVPTILLVPSMVPSTEFLSADLRLTGNSGNKEIKTVSDLRQHILLGKQLALKKIRFKNLSCPGWCGSVGWSSSHKAKGHWFDSRSGHMPELWVRSPVQPID